MTHRSPLPHHAHRRPCPLAFRYDLTRFRSTASVVGRIAMETDLNARPERTTDGDDHELALGIRSGDPDALEEFYDRTSKQAFGLAYRILRNGASAEDAVQEAYLMVWRQGSKLDPTRGSLKSLLMTVVHRRAIDTLRSERGQRAAVASQDLDYLVGTSPDPAEGVALTMDREEVRTALGSLPADQRSPVELAFFKGLTHVEISEKLGVPLGTVKSRLRLAMDKLRIALGNI